MEDKQYLDEAGLGEVGKVISKFYASKDDVKNIDVTKQLDDYAKKTDLDNKVDKVDGKFLSSNDYTSEDKAKVDAIPENPHYTDTTYDLSGYATKEDVPTKLSQLNNDRAFKTESEIKQLINDSKKLKKEIVDSLPTAGEEDVIYLLKNKNNSNNVYAEYLWINNNWEIIGDTKVDLTDYVKKSDVKTNLSEMIEDSVHRVVTDKEKSNWNNKVDKINGKSLSTHDFTDEMLQNFEKMKLEQKRLDVIKELKLYGISSHGLAIISGDYGVIDVNGWVDLIDYEGVVAVENNNYLFEHLKNRDITVSNFMQLTVTREERIDNDGNKVYAILQTLRDPLSGVAFANMTKTFKKEYSDKEILKNIKIEEIWMIEDVVPRDDWHPWALQSDYNATLMAVHAGKRADGYSCGLMTPDDKLKLDSINVEAINSANGNSNTNTIKVCNVEQEILSKGADAPVGFYLNSNFKNDQIQLYRVEPPCVGIPQKRYTVFTISFSAWGSNSPTQTFEWENEKWNRINLPSAPPQQYSVSFRFSELERTVNQLKTALKDLSRKPQPQPPVVVQPSPYPPVE